ncbi:hypothetical protein GCM10010174_63910 [Kutzneria viridogrisea]|uniref:HTH merR-type domain-containing protein n=2 Tax=Kutzneria TaxID=43356 RepID=W5WIT8_9PSEU|nr:MerR family transcriptional regulator [Kutzneria albida]AHI00522.1 hypothetical protein KALB_7164 [Kutzneria albida DSM 43870]MBA8925701.1 DNA-binding transcriptional MerR regulator [Kutzneria viridogrisea]
MSVELSVEELAGRVGVPTSTVRMYQTKGLLHPPRKVGRTARYDSSHLQRMVLVQRLQERGFSLPSIAELIAAREQGATVAEVLGLSGGPEDWVPLGLRELRRLVKARDLRPKLLRRASKLGLIRWRAGRPQTRRWALESGLRLCELDMPPEEVLDQFVRLRAGTDQIAADFVAVFERRLWPQVAAGSNQADQLGRVRALLEELTGIAEGVVVGALRQSVREAAEEFARRHELVPAQGEGPAWLSQPVPVLREHLTDSAEEDPDIERFLAEEEHQ